jgi:hypothetical protein
MGMYIITNIALTSNVVTVTASNAFAIGDIGYIYDLSNASFSVLAGKQFTVTGANGSSFTYSYTNGNIASEAVTRGYAIFSKSYTVGPVWSSITRTPMTMIYRDTLDYINTQQWTCSTTLNVLAGTYLYANVGNGTTITWTSPMSVPVGNYMIFNALQRASTCSFMTIDVSCAGGAYQTVMHRYNSYSTVTVYTHVNVYFTVTTAGTLAIRWTADNKSARSTDYYLLVCSPFILYRL